jgi:hypothetical protein
MSGKRFDASFAKLAPDPKMVKAETGTTEKPKAPVRPIKCQRMPSVMLVGILSTERTKY